MKAKLKSKSFINRLSLGCFMTLVSVCVGCGDRSQEEYDRNRVQSEMESFKKVEGVYDGALISSLTGDDLGIFRVSLEAKTIVVSQTSISTQQQLSLGGQLQLQTGSLMSFEFSNGFYSPETGDVDLPFELQRSDGSKIQMRLKAKLEEETLVGRLVADGYSERGAEFSLKRKTRDYRSMPASVIENIASIDRTYRSWVAQTDKGEVELRLFEQDAQSESEEFISLFVPIRLVDSVIYFYSTLPVSFPGGRFDERTGILRAEQKSGKADSEDSRNNLILECRTGPSLLNTKLMKCRYINLTNSLVMDFDMKSLD